MFSVVFVRAFWLQSDKKLQIIIYWFAISYSPYLFVVIISIGQPYYLWRCLLVTKIAANSIGDSTTDLLKEIEILKGWEMNIFYLNLLFGALIFISVKLYQITKAVLEIASTHKALLDYFHRVLN